MSVDDSDSDDMEAEFVHVSDEEEYLEVPDQASMDPAPVQVLRIIKFKLYFIRDLFHKFHQIKKTHRNVVIFLYKLPYNIIEH